MTKTTTRAFEDRPAVRERVPLLIGLMGPSGGGKTYSALRLATGIQAVSGGDVFVVDTEARRALHYADKFKFRHLAFGAPFGPLDYLAAIEHCVAKGAGVVIVDSMSHEHEGQGGLLEMHEREVARLSGGDQRKAERVKMLAWSQPKQQRRRLINTILQLPCNFVFCWRAKQKLKIKRGEEPQQMGFMPIAGEEFVYEMAVNALLLPGAGGVPTWQSGELGEQQMIKLPGWARSMLPSGDRPLDEGTGTKLAQWAAGTVVRGAAELVAAYAACSDPATLGSLEQERRGMWERASTGEKKQLKDAADAATTRVQTATADPPAPQWDPTTGEVLDEPAPEQPPPAAQVVIDSFAKVSTKPHYTNAWKKHGASITALAPPWRDYVTACVREAGMRAGLAPDELP